MTDRIYQNRIIRIAGVLLAILLGIVNVDVVACAKETPDELKNLYARSAVLMDADSGRILFGKNEKDILPMASTTKIMTCILALEQMNEEQIAVVSENAARQPKVHLGVKAEERYYLKDLLYSLMLESHNDSAVVIAEAISGTVEAFADQMNQKAEEIGCENTYFITPNGLDAEDETGIHSTTASDLALIIRYCIQISPQKDKFLEITQKQAYQFSDVDENRTFHCNNHNAFLTMMEGALSGKTGFTNDAGYCYVGALKRDDRTFIVALLACGWPNHKSYKWTDTRKLMEYALSNYEYYTVSKYEKTEPVLVKDGVNINEPMQNEICVSTKLQDDNKELKILMREDEKIKTTAILKERVQAPVQKGEVVGMIFYSLDEYILHKKYVVTSEGVEKRNVYILWKYIVKTYFV